MNIEQIIDDIIDREGGYVDHPHDRGGPTNWGITEKVARAHDYTGDMRNLPKGKARDIYRLTFWYSPGFDAVAALSASVAEELADTGVNMGPRTASKFLQRALNVLNRDQRDYSDLIVDGVLGSVSCAALGAYLKKRGRSGETELIKLPNALQAARYVEIAERDPKQEAFVYGWLQGRVA